MFSRKTRGIPRTGAEDVVAKIEKATPEDGQGSRVSLPQGIKRKKKRHLFMSLVSCKNESPVVIWDNGQVMLTWDLPSTDRATRVETTQPLGDWDPLLRQSPLRPGTV